MGLRIHLGEMDSAKISLRPTYETGMEQTASFGHFEFHYNSHYPFCNLLVMNTFISRYYFGYRVP